VTRLLLLRHAESEWNAQGRWQGLADSPLSDHGRRQAGAAGVALAGRDPGFTILAASDLHRARLTALLMAPPLGLSEVVLDPGLREYDVGLWSGLTRPEIEARWPGALDDWRHGRLVATPRGEKRDVFVARIAATVSRLGAANPGETILVITHGGVIGALERSLGLEPRRVAHLSGRWIEADGHGLVPGAGVTLESLPDAGDGEGSEFPRSA